MLSKIQWVVLRLLVWFEKHETKMTQRNVWTQSRSCKCLICKTNYPKLNLIIRCRLPISDISLSKHSVCSCMFSIWKVFVSVTRCGKCQCHPVVEVDLIWSDLIWSDLIWSGECTVVDEHVEVLSGVWVVLEIQSFTSNWIS